MENTMKIPTIDLSPFFKENEEKSQKEVINKIKEACSKYGFFQVENHGVPNKIMNEALELSRRFFSNTEDEKLKFSPAHDAPLPAGYFKQPAHSEDKNEFVLMFTPAAGFNVYPTNPPEFKEIFEGIFSEFAKLASLMERIISECMGLGPNFLKDFNSDRNADFMVGLNYFPATEEENTGIREHEDGNCFTFVLQDDSGGLEVKAKDGWIPVTPAPEKLVVNVGDVIQVLSNNKLKSATHRIFRPKGKNRYSYVFFHNMKGDKWIEPLPEFTKDIGEAPQYKGFFQKDYQALRLRNKTHPPENPEDEIRITHYAI
ncbi:jasmonate-induced oxygenase 2-like [Silene latifolia]|uniref:jasmonate-induced oxygenase 2-like n=1 Tax=Silene latifolia TaxID=37657 RepID=UPI003D78189E